LQFRSEGYVAFTLFLLVLSKKITKILINIFLEMSALRQT
jgi:hypothetical protein